ncbi:glycosyltransferase family 8 protein [Campylobacter jejuni]|nr:glycosyltransferase family 8 protein [Campylobacter jejuni]
MENNISPENKNKILSLKCHNVDIIFINIKNILSQINKELLYERAHFTIEAWFRIFIPRIFKNFNRILYLDCDLLILNDVAKLYNMQMQKPLAASIDIIMKALNADPAFHKNYLENTLKLKKPDGYFQSGVLLFDIFKCLEFDMEKKCLNILQNKNEIFKYLDQDVLNIVFENNVDYIDSSWNVEKGISYYHLHFIIPKKWTNKYNNDIKNPKIIHYCGPYKPWIYTEEEYSYIWWQYARKTNVYEEIIYKNLNKRNFINHVNTVNTVNAVNIIKNHLSFKLGEILLDTKTFFKIIVFPFRILKTIVQHKLQQILYKSMQNLNSNLKLPSIENCHDYYEAIKIRNYLTYRLGNAFVKHPFTFIFRIRKIYIEWRKIK